MAQSFSPWLLLMAVVSVGVGATYLACPGCVDRQELAIRYADTEFARRFGGRPGHSGLLERGRVRDECMTRLVAVIESSQVVTPQDVERARAGRSAIFDAVVLPCLFQRICSSRCGPR